MNRAQSLIGRYPTSALNRCVIDDNVLIKNNEGFNMHATIRQLTTVTALMTIGTAQAASVVVPVGSAFNGISFYGAQLADLQR